MLAEGGTDAGDQLRGREGLDDVVGGAGFEGARDGLVAAVGRYEDDRQVAELRHVGHELDAVDIGKQQVEKHQMGAVLADQGTHLAGIAGDEGGVVRAIEGIAREAQRTRVVVDHQDPGLRPLVGVGHGVNGRTHVRGGDLAGGDGERDPHALAQAGTFGADASAVRLDETFADREA